MAWNRYSAWEPRAIEVSQGRTPAPDLRVSTGEFKPTRTRMTWAAGLLILLMGLLVLGIVFRFGEVGILRRAREGRLPSFQALKDNNDRQNAAGGLIIWGTFAAGVAWLMWQHRSQSNLRGLGVADLRFTPGWAVGWWLIPFANIVMPYQTMRELTKASDPNAGAVDWKARPTPSILPLWWTGFLGRLALLGFAAAVASDDPPTISQQISRDWLVIVSYAVAIVAAILAIRILRLVTGRQEEKRRKLQSWSGPTS
jgi:hypothetical protein